MPAVVLDASVLLAVIYGEPGAAAAAHLPQGLISAVNVCEVLSDMIHEGYPPPVAWLRIQDLPVEVVSMDAELARAAAELLPPTRALGLSLGDRACLALAKQRKLPALTADRAWAKLRVGVEVRLIR